MLVVEPNLPDPEILFNGVCTPGVLYTRSPTFGFEKFFWDVCWPTVLRTHGIGLIVVFSHGISPIKETHCNTAMDGMVWYCILL